MQQRIEAARREGFAALSGLRDYLGEVAVPANPDFVQVCEAAARAFLWFCDDPEHGDAAAERAASYARTFGEWSLATAGDHEGARALLELAVRHRDRAGRAAGGLVLTLANACRVGEDFAGAERALGYYAEWRSRPAWREWREDPKFGEWMPVFDVQYERARAMLESSVGNPDGVLHHLRQAQAWLDARPHEFVGPAAVELRQAWEDAELGLLLDRIDCYCNFENFARAASFAERAIVRATEIGIEPGAFRLSLALARGWDPAATAAQRQDAELELAAFAAGPVPAYRQLALRSLLELATAQDQTARAQELLAELRESSGGLGFAETSLETELLLRRHRREPRDVEELRNQERAQREAFEQLLATWRRMPLRPGGNGFLHYLERREAIGQLVAITLAAAAPGGEPPRAAIEAAMGDVMATQTHSLLADRLGAGVPTLAELTSALAPKQGILLFLPTRSATHVFAIDRDGLLYRELPAGAVAIRGDVQSFVDVLRRATDRLEHSEGEARTLVAELHTIGTRLADLLVPAPLRARLATWDAMTVIGSELLHGPVSGSADAGFANHLPFECLPWGEQEIFGERFAIDHCASLPVWRRLVERAVPAGARSALSLFGVLAPEAASAAESGIPREDRLAPTWGRDCGAAFGRREVICDEACVRAAIAGARVARAAGERASIAVFLAHGGYDGSQERGAYLQFVDGRLDCAGVEALGDTGRPFADIVVLAACRAAKGPTRAGDSAANLGSAFLLAGATAVVQSRFDLPLLRTQAALERFLDRLARGGSVAAAMQAARAAARTGDDPLDVYRVGVLQVHGCGQTPIER